MKRGFSRRPNPAGRPPRVFYGFSPGARVVVRFDAPQWSLSDRTGIVTRIPKGNRGRISVRMDGSRKVRTFLFGEIMLEAEFKALAARVRETDARLRAALATLGYRFQDSTTHGRVTDYQYQVDMNFISQEHGSLHVALSPNFYG